MTQQDFEERTGASLAAEDYAKIEQIYLNVQPMGEDEFCIYWRTKTGRRAIIDALVKQITEKEKQDGIIDFLVGNPDAAAVRQKAIELLGDEREYIRRKCERGLPLDADDKAAILRLL